MPKKLLFRLIIDLVMILLLMLAFAYYLTGNLIHELTGTFVLILFMAHSIINGDWYKRIFKKKCGFQLIISDLVALLLLLTVLILLFSSLMISRTLFVFTAISSDKVFFMRQIHLLAAYWTLLLASVHLGLQWNIVLGFFYKLLGLLKPGLLGAAVLRLSAVFLVFYGVKSSFELSMGSKLLMRASFTYWDFEASTLGFFISYLAVMGMYAIITHYFLKLVKRFK